MKERPILFSDQRVRALLSGQQRQTRRIMKSQLFGSVQDNHEGCYGIDVLSNNLQGNRVLGMEISATTARMVNPAIVCGCEKPGVGRSCPRRKWLSTSTPHYSSKISITASTALTPAFTVPMKRTTSSVGRQEFICRAGPAVLTCLSPACAWRESRISATTTLWPKGCRLIRTSSIIFSPCTAKPFRRKMPTASSGLFSTAAPVGK